MYKAVCLFDLDKTLLNDEKQVPPENVTALKSAEANHVLPECCYWPQLLRTR